MAKVLIDSGPISATYPLRDVPREKWRDLMLARRSFLEITLSHDCRCLIEFCNDAKQMFEPLGFRSVEHMIHEGYGLVPDEINVAVEWLKLNPPVEPITLDQAITLGKQAGRTDDVRDEKGRYLPKDSNTTIGRGCAYILARLDRDGHAELAAKVRAGKMSANAAAIEAGFRKQATPVEQVLKLLAKLTPAQWRHVRARGDQMFGSEKGKRAA
jgi:hypothetical protein